MWIARRTERVTTLLAHLRKLVREPDLLVLAATKLSGLEYAKLKVWWTFVKFPALKKG